MTYLRHEKPGLILIAAIVIMFVSLMGGKCGAADVYEAIPMPPFGGGEFSSPHDSWDGNLVQPEIRECNGQRYKWLGGQWWNLDCNHGPTLLYCPPLDQLPCDESPGKFSIKYPDGTTWTDGQPSPSVSREEYEALLKRVEALEIQGYVGTLDTEWAFVPFYGPTIPKGSYLICGADGYVMWQYDPFDGRRWRLHNPPDWQDWEELVLVWTGGIPATRPWEEIYIINQRLNDLSNQIDDLRTLIRKYYLMKEIR